MQPLASLLCLGGVKVSGPERVQKAESRLCWQSIGMWDASRCEWAARLIYDGLHAEMCTRRTASPGAH